MVADPEGCPDGVTLRFAAQAALSQVVGQHKMDDVLTRKRQEVETETQVLLQQILDDHGTGIQIENLLLPDVKSPEEVRAAFDDVLRARQERDTMINQARIKESGALPEAVGEAERLIIETEAARDVRMIQAEGNVGRFISILRGYASEEIEALKQLHLESLDEILPGIGPFIAAVDTVSRRRFQSGPFAARLVRQTVPVIYFDAGNNPGDLSQSGWRPLLTIKDEPGGSLLLIDARPIILPDKYNDILVFDLYALYRVTNPTQFAEATHPLGKGSFFLEEIITTALAEQIALTSLPKIIGAEPVLDSFGIPVEDTEGLPIFEATDYRSQILEPTLKAVQAEIDRAQPPVGLEVEDIRIKSVGFPDTVTPSMFTRMRAERNRIASRFRAEGEEIAQSTFAEAEASRDVILAEAQIKVDTIIAEAEAAAVDLLLQAVAEEPELSKYQKALEAYKVSKGLVKD